jgi:transcriptional regulator with XRE-family HTH domain
MRLAAGLTIRRMEDLTGINRGRLSILERGVTPNDDEAAKILAALRKVDAA